MMNWLTIIQLGFLLHLGVLLQATASKNADAIHATFSASIGHDSLATGANAASSATSGSVNTQIATIKGCTLEQLFQRIGEVLSKTVVNAGASILPSVLDDPGRNRIGFNISVTADHNGDTRRGIPNKPAAAQPDARPRPNWSDPQDSSKSPDVARSVITSGRHYTDVKVAPLQGNWRDNVSPAAVPGVTEEGEQSASSEGAPPFQVSSGFDGAGAPAAASTSELQLPQQMNSDANANTNTFGGGFSSISRSNLEHDEGNTFLTHNIPDLRSRQPVYRSFRPLPADPPTLSHLHPTGQYR